MADIRFKIVKNYGVLSTANKSGWTKELNLVSWNDREPKLDIREWSQDHTQMSKGITLTFAEAESLYNLLSEEALMEAEERDKK